MFGETTTAVSAGGLALTMAVASLTKAIRRLFNGPRASESVGATSDAGEIDSDNPFPEVVVIEFRDVLDLHSIPPRQVKAVVQGYLQEAREHGARRVRIIHGKGIGVQREAVRSILSGSSFVESFGDAPLELGGWGATVAILGPDPHRGPAK